MSIMDLINKVKIKPFSVNIVDYGDSCAAEFPTVAMAKDALTIAQRFDEEATRRNTTLFFFDPYGLARGAMQDELGITFVEQAQTGDGFTSW